MSQNLLKFDKNYSYFENFEVVEHLPNKVLELKESITGVFVTDTGEFSLPKKIYSNDFEFIEHVLLSYEKIDKGVGVSLEGKKGLGKTLTAKILCNRLKLPVINITNALSKNMFGFLNKIKQEHIIYIDEFEKLFAEHSTPSIPIVDQEDFLSFLDGSNTSDTKRLFIITTNSKINNYLLNRPTRIRFVRNYEFLSDNIIKEILEDKLINKEIFYNDLVDNLEKEELNIDSLIEIINEINNTNKPYSYFKQFFNYKVDKVDYHFYLVDQHDGKELIDTQVLTEQKIKDVEKQHIRLDNGKYSLTKIIGYENNQSVIYFKGIEHLEKDKEGLLKTVPRMFVAIKNVINRIQTLN